MPIPVPLPPGPLPIDDGINAAAEAALTKFIQLVAAGTTGSSIVTPGISVDLENTGTVTPVQIVSAEEQLYPRHMMLAVLAAVTPASGKASVAGGATTAAVADPRIVAATSKVFITPMSANTFWFGATGWWVTLVDGTFTLHSANAAAGTASFAWLLIP